ncbi:MAG: HAMP domain-containing histidine kinase [Clostridia bacterium]|nr:HAMP domain-containing histidine kinase [Clostridia bacterium]
MIKKLRVKFVCAAMLSSFIVLFGIIGIINALNFVEVVNQADITISLLQENDGEFPKKEEMMPKPDRGPLSEPLMKELPYESRFFTVTIKDGEAVSIETGRIAAVDEKTAEDFAKRVIDDGNGKGFLKTYRYHLDETADGTRVIFLDCTRNLSTFFSFLTASIGISSIGLLLILIILIFVSGRVVRPVSESFEKQKQFITDAGHEIKTPVTIIDADAEVIKMETGENEWLNDIQLQSKRLASLTNDLIYLSRMEECESELQLLEFPLSDVVSETAQSFQSLAKLGHKTFSQDIQPMIEMKGDENAIRRLVYILLDNAVKYSDENGEISLKLERNGKNIRLQIENTTSKPLPENLMKMFDRFYRGDKSRNSKTGGYGLGLAIAKVTAEAHKGRINLTKSSENRLCVKVIF